MIFKGAANARLERDHHERTQREEKLRRAKGWRRDWVEQLRTMPVLIHGFLTRIGTKSAIPPVLRSSKDAKGLDEHRLRAALTQLTTLSLVFHSRDTRCYSMHPLVHTWVRERPGMSTGEQAIYCHAAATLLAQCVLLPPLGTDESAENLKAEICPHVDQVQKFKISIEKSLELNRASRAWYKRPVPSLQAYLDRDTALQLVKFSLVYTQAGRWLETKTLQETVRSFVLQYLGQKHNSSIDVTLLLSGTLWQLGQGDEAAALQAKVLELCRQTRGHDDAKTLKVMDALGVSHWLQGKFSIALLLHEEATAGLERRQGSGHPDTLIAQGNLGRVLTKQCRYDEAIELHTKAVHGLKGVYGASHLETLVAMDNLAMTYLDRFMYANGPGSDLGLAHDLEVHVMDTRKLRLGPEHTYTLWATCNLARVKAAQGKVIEAEYMMTKGIKIATINLGPTHIGTLFGKLYLAHTLTSAKKFDQAEKMLNEVLDGHKSTGRPNHPDAFLAMSYLIRCYRSSKRDEDARQWRERLEAAIEAAGGQDHPFKKHLLDPRVEGFGMQMESTPIRSVHGDSAQQQIGRSDVSGGQAIAKLVLTRSSTA
ncbi:uncharacterized protein Z518_08196 [Rhinocladiella mackenziei CBS 650.93]|uniref:Kinesin light chain n=1 Tax=Rhinocladiella mackenziei CBS 650.93 TaxID=1442369 RepID=A0A0D2FJW0_9EURO|nr:uncharacterized protein Z518_08196 [Rhinocladiella mackenziei CBS 650.93]KIX02257.1 hypothetical protein Z518_08196 [Rhinocladiella mackenziei CBS 650.93]